MEARELLKMDADRYRRLRIEAAKEPHLKLTADLQRELEFIDQAKESVIATYERRGTRVWGAFHDTYLAGAVAMSFVHLAAEKHQLWLWGLYVVPRFRGTPASRCLMNAVQDWNERFHPGSVIMGAFDKSNRHAWQMVSRFGFDASTRKQDAEEAGLITADDVVVERGNRSSRGLSHCA